MRSSASAPVRPILVVNQTAQMGGGELSMLDLLAGRPGLFRVVLFDDGPLVSRLSDVGIDCEVMPVVEGLAHFRRKAGIGAAVRAFSGMPSPLMRLAALADRSRLVYTNSQKAAFLGGLAARLSGVPCVWHQRTVLDSYYSGFARIATVTASELLCDRMIAPTRTCAEGYVASGGSADRVLVIPDGFDPPRFVRDAGTRMRVRTALGLESDRNVVGCLSRLTRWKGQHVLLDAVARLPEVTVLLVGDALFGGDAEYADSLRERAGQPDLRGRVRFLGHRDDAVDILCALDAVIVPSVESEAFGRVAIEGQLSGVPVIASDLGGSRETIRQRETGLLVPPENPAALAEAIALVLDDPAFADGLAGRARRYAAETFDIHGIRTRTYAVFEEVAPGCTELPRE